jgi:hypothetical protein
LAAIAILSLVPMLILSKTEFISYDGYWHLWIATQNRWKQFLFEYRGDAHPILYVALLRGLAAISHARLVLRAGSYLPGAASVYFIGLIAARLCRSKLFPLLVAAAYGLSMTMIQIHVDVRSYPLCLLLALAALYCLITGLQEPDLHKAGRWLIWFGVWTAGSISSEYYALFFFFACAGAVVLIALGGSLPRLPAKAAWAGLGIPVLTTLWLYYTHLAHQPKQYGHVSAFYWNHAESRWAYVLRNLQSDLNYIVPRTIEQRTVLIACSAAGLLVLLVFPFLQGRSLTRRLAGIPGLLVIFIFVQLAVAGLLGRYPFGGFERQQSIAFPFLILSAFIVLDWLLSFVKVPGVGPVIAAACAFAIGSQFVHSWRTLPRRSEELVTREYSVFRANMSPASDAVFLDEYSFFGYYIGTHDWKWKFWQEIQTPQRVELYRSSKVGQRPLVIQRALQFWNFDVANLGNYRSVAQAMRASGTRNATLFVLKQVPGPKDPADLEKQRTVLMQLGSQAGLQIGSVYDDVTELVANLSITTDGK